jgi:hypothetical protein
MSYWSREKMLTELLMEANAGRVATPSSARRSGTLVEQRGGSRPPLR